MKTPVYWKNRNIKALTLLPIGWVYAGLTALRLLIKKPFATDCPVICIGNLTAGGTGKTPTAVAIAKIVKELGYNPFFVSRGYGGNLSGVIVNREKHTPKQVGDEPLLLAREAEVSINPNRAFAAQKAISEGATALIMDDGFQNPSLKKNISFLVFDGGFGIGNGWPLPAGPLRESFNAGLKRADAAIIIGQDTTNLCGKLKNIPIFKAVMQSLPLQNTKQKAIAFAGIGRPEKFYNSLREMQIEIIKTIDFPDHHFYTENELKQLIEEARKFEAQLITTAKDFVKIPANLQKYFNVLEIEIKWDNREALKTFIQNKFASLKK